MFHSAAVATKNYDLSIAARGVEVAARLTGANATADVVADPPANPSPGPSGSGPSSGRNFGARNDEELADMAKAAFAEKYGKGTFP